MAVEYGMSMIDEIKGVLEQRRDILEQFGTYKVMYGDLLQNLAKTYHTDMDTAVTAFYLANYVMDKLKRNKEARDMVDEDENVKVVLEHLLIAKKHLTIDSQSLVHLYTLIYDWIVKIDKDLIKHARLFVNQKVIMTNIVDIYTVPFFTFLKQAIPNIDLRWAMSEISGGLNKGFASDCYEDIKLQFPIAEMDPLYYFDAGFFVVRPFVEKFFSDMFEDGVKELESFGDIGRKSYEFANSIFYDVESREVFTHIAYDEKLKIDEALEKELKNSLYINHMSAKSDNPYQLIFAKYHIQIKALNQRSEEKFFYIHNLEEKSTNNGYSNTLGNWNYFLLSSEDVNLQSIISYSKQRCIDIRGISSRLENLGDNQDDQINTILSAWMEMFIHNLQQEYNFLEIKDELREQNFLPIGLLKQDKSQSNLFEILLDSPKSITSKRMNTLGIKSGMVDKDQTERLLDHMKIISDHCSNVMRLVLIQNNPNLTIDMYPIEFLYEDQRQPGKNIAVLFSADESKLVGILCQNEASLEFQAKSLILRQIFSKTNQLLTDLRIKTLADARAAKLADYITRGVESLYEPGSLWLSGEISESFGISSTDESVTDRIDLAIKREKERLEAMRLAEIKRQEALEKDRQERLYAKRVLYFNESFLTKFFEKISLELQNSLLLTLKEGFPDICGLEKEQHRIKIRLNDIETKTNDQNDTDGEIKEIFDELTQETIESLKVNVSEVTTKLKSIWDLISELPEDKL